MARRKPEIGNFRKMVISWATLNVACSFLRFDRKMKGSSSKVCKNVLSSITGFYGPLEAIETIVKIAAALQKHKMRNLEKLLITILLFFSYYKKPCSKR